MSGAYSAATAIVPTPVRNEIVPFFLPMWPQEDQYDRAARWTERFAGVMSESEELFGEWRPILLDWRWFHFHMPVHDEPASPALEVDACLKAAA